ncbi:integrase [Streptomyces sp. NPDC002994]|uniref:tyrosine-type recombinase/integrase n=1 Tax=Streptomyces sp. NPDC002994 TaxID=3154441 RepID=UPI0033BE2E8F
MSRVHQHVHVEWRGGTCRVKWWTGELLPSGRKRYESKGGFTDEEKAVQHGLDQLYEIRHGTHVSNRDGSMLMTDWLDDWLASLDLAHLSLRTYSWAINSYIRPFFGKSTVSEIDILGHRAFKKHLTKASLSDSSIRHILMVFSMVMTDAVAAGLRKTSPVERQRRRGKFKRKPREKKKDMPIEVIDRIARNAEIRWGYAGYVFFWTMAMTGMRPAEMYGLTREYCYPNWPGTDPRPDPDEADQYGEDMERYGKGEGLMPAIRVERQMQYEDSKLKFFPPKYGSKRTLVVPSFLADMLERLLASHNSDYVFPGIEGNCLAALAFHREYWRPIVNGAEAVAGPRVLKPRPAIPEVPSFKGKRMYLIRHGHKAWLDEDGHSRFAVESRMGHEMQGVEGTYSNVTPAMERAIIDAFGKRWDELRSRLPAEAASEVLPRAPVPSVAELVRLAVSQGITDRTLVVREVHKVRPKALGDTVKRTLGRQLRR